MKKIFCFCLLIVSLMSASAQDESYRGGIADGHALVSIQTTFGNPVSFQPYFGGNADGHAGDSLISFTQYASINMFSPYIGNIADGGSGDSLMSFGPRNYITMFQPYASGSGDGWTGFPVFGVTIVPLNLISFFGERAGKANILHWTTSHEENTARFDLERSANGAHFTRLGMVPAAGNSSTERHYQYNDINPLQGNNYYRLKIFDRDGTFKYSNIILLQVTGLSSLSVYPNPTTKTLNVHISGIDDQTNVSASIFDVNGKYIQGMSAQQVNATFRFDVEGLPAGIYLLKVMWNNETSVWRFIKE